MLGSRFDILAKHHFKSQYIAYLEYTCQQILGFLSLRGIVSFRGNTGLQIHPNLGKILILEGQQEGINLPPP